MAVFYYHRVGPFRPGAPRRLNVDPAHFRAHMRVLAERARPVSLDAWVEAAEGGRPLPSGAVAVTFDDGHRDLLAHAVPILREFRIPAAFFLVTGAMGGRDDWNGSTGVPLEPILTWDEAKRIRDDGFAIGSHSRTHRVLPDLDGPALADEIRGSREDLRERLGVEARHFAYPQGGFGPGTERAVAEAGYAAGWATRKGRPAGPGDLFAIRRIPVSGYIKGLRFRWELFLRRRGWKKD